MVGLLGGCVGFGRADAMAPDQVQLGDSIPMTVELRVIGQPHEVGRRYTDVYVRPRNLRGVKGAIVECGQRRTVDDKVLYCLGVMATDPFTVGDTVLVDASYIFDKVRQVELALCRIVIASPDEPLVPRERTRHGNSCDRPPYPRP
jgi:hypothetical protein